MEEPVFQYDEGFVWSSRGVKLFTCQWLPMKEEAKGLIFICHGYAMECSITMNSTAIRLARAGFAVYGMDYEGHGKSDGLPALITSVDYIVQDCLDHFSKISERSENRGKRRFLLGESLGGAVALLLHRKKPTFWDGAVLVAPMCKISDEMRPHPIVISVLSRLSNYLPTWKAIPGKDIIDVAFKEPGIRSQVSENARGKLEIMPNLRRVFIRANPYCYKGPLRLKTGHELLNVSMGIEKRLNEVSMPFIVLHGEEDKVIEKEASVELCNVASSKDKTLKLYSGMWHGLLYGEPQNNIDIIFSDIISWLEERVVSTTSWVETEQKFANEDQFQKR